MGTHAQAAPDEKPIPWIARQPILTKDENVVGYELLFSQSPEEHSFTSDADSANSATIDTLSVMEDVVVAVVEVDDIGGGNATFYERDMVVFERRLNLVEMRLVAAALGGLVDQVEQPRG